MCSPQQWLSLPVCQSASARHPPSHPHTTCTPTDCSPHLLPCSHVESDAHTGPTWRDYVKSTWSESHPGAPTMECAFEVEVDEKPVFTSFEEKK